MLKTEKISADLCVIGGGMAGICTAIAAAREGIDVILVHERPVLGGNASSEIRMWVCGAQGENMRETGIIEEIMLENLYRNPTKNFYIWDTVLYDFVKREKKIKMLLNCTCMDAETQTGDFSDGRDTKIKSIKAYQLTTQKFFEINAKFYADCSGDSILAPLTGAHYRWGREDKEEFGEETHVEKSDRMTMGMSCLIQGRETTNPVDFTAPDWSVRLSDDDVKNRAMNIYSTMENFWYLELGGDRNTIDDTEEIKEELIPLAIGAWDYIKKNDERSKNWELEFLGFLPGKRESRRMCGEYMVTQRDISDNRIFEDTVAYGGWPIDDHFPGGYYHRGNPNTDIKTPAPYCLPYRALYSENVENLFFAGRNISMTHLAMSSIRVMATCALLGQAVGTAAAIAVKCGETPNGVYKNRLGELQNTLMNNDCFLPHFTRGISAACKNAALIGADSALCDGVDRVNKIYENTSCGKSVKNGEAIEYRLEKPEKIGGVHIVFDSDLNRETLPGDWCERYHSMRANVLLDSPVMHLPKTLCKSFSLEIESDGEWRSVLDIDNNRKRSYHLPIDGAVSGIRLRVRSNWGESDSTNILSFDF